ncbi:MAG TPA: hypothetical protein VGP80_02350, partial [Gemmatimonadales bacterium]|nr:hypothetical protein [Gemmatimonadales bacterium]
MNLTRSLPRVLALLTGGLAVAGNARAQVTGAIEAGSGAVRLGASTATEVLSVAPVLQMQGKYFRLDARGDYAEHADRGWQTSGLMAAAFQLPLARGLKVELAGTGGWSRLSWGQAAAGTLAEARLQLAGPISGLELSAGTGRAFPDGPSGALSRVEARTWSRMAGLDFGFLLRRTGVMTPGTSTRISG